MIIAGKAYAAAPFAAFGIAGAAVVDTAIAPLVTDGDTTRDPNGNLLDAAEPILEEVAFYLATSIGSFFGVQTIGNGVYRMHVRRRTSVVEVRDHVRRALKFMIERGDITDLTVTPQPVTRNGTAINYYDVAVRLTNIVRR